MRFSFLQKYKVLFVSLGVVFLYSVTLAYAAGGPFSPHQTLDPNCLPTTATCYVTSGGGGSGVTIGDPVFGGTPGQILYTDAAGKVSSDSNFTRDNVNQSFYFATPSSIPNEISFIQTDAGGASVGIGYKNTSTNEASFSSCAGNPIGCDSTWVDNFSSINNTTALHIGHEGARLETNLRNSNLDANFGLTSDTQSLFLQNGNNFRTMDLNPQTFAAKLGDVDNHGNGTLFNVDDQHQIISGTVKESATQSLVMEVIKANNSSVLAASDTSVGASGAAGYNSASLAGGPSASVGYIDFGTGKSNQITTNVNGINANLGYGNSSNFIINNSSNNTIFQTDNTSTPKIQVGDITGTGNKTLLVVNDSTSTVEVSATNGLSVGGSITQTAAQGCNILADSTGQIVCAPSDINLKQNVSDLSYGLDTVMKLHPVTYTFKDIKYGSGAQIGFIAQELEQYIPEVVTQGPQYKSVNYGVLTSVLAKAIQELNIKVQSLGGITTNDSSFASVVASWLGNAGNNITRIFTGEICLTDPGQDPECINRDQLRQLKQLLNSNQTSVQTPQIETPAN